MTLEQLKALSDEELYYHWLHSQFPFEKMRCGSCLTQHVLQERYSTFQLEGNIYGRQKRKCQHEILSDQIRALWMASYTTMDVLRHELEQLFALRLFYRDEYEQPVPADALEAEVTHQPEPILT